jgi:hypothetical protein
VCGADGGFLFQVKGVFMKKIFICCVISFFLISQSSCGNKKEIQNARAKLELAKKKIDLDQMYLVLTELKNLGDTDQKIADELKKVEEGIPLLEKIKLNKSDHQHEEIVKAANKFLEYYPDHIEARKALKESGLIFYYLQESINLLNRNFEYEIKTIDYSDYNEVRQALRKSGLIFVYLHDSINLLNFEYESNNPKAHLIKTSPDEKENKIKIDYSKIIHNINKAEQYIIEAKKLDPYFDKALSIEKSIHDTKNTIGILLSDDVVTWAEIKINSYLEFFSIVSDGFESVIKSRYSSISVYWNGMSPMLQDFKKTDTPLLDELNKLSSYLDYYKESEISSLAMTVKEINITLNTLIEAVVYPKGSVVDYRKDVRTIESKIDDLIAKYRASSPNSDATAENIKGFAKTLHDYQLFITPEETKNILEQRKNMIQI